MTSSDHPKKPDRSENVSAAVWFPLSQLVPWVRNPRHNDHRVQEMVSRIRRWGWGNPALAWKNALEHRYPDGLAQPAGHRIAAGHLRRKAMLWIWEHDPAFRLPDAPAPGLIPVRFMSFTSEGEYAAFALQDNNPLGEWDDPAVGSLLQELQVEGIQVEDLGWSDEDLAELLRDAEESSAAALQEAGAPAAGGPHNAPLMTQPGTPPSTGSSPLGEASPTARDPAVGAMAPLDGGPVPESRYKEQYGVIVICADAKDQERVYTDLVGRGLNCRVVVT